MVIGLDSATPPSPGEVVAAKAGGIALWNGYLSSVPFDGKSHLGLARPWSQGEFKIVKSLPGTPIAYASGWDNAVACKKLAAAWGVRLCLDVEGGIRADGPWVEQWLADSGAGLYGVGSVHYNSHGPRVAAFHIFAGYFGYDPKATWPGFDAKPGTPCAWQWQNTHSEFGVGVDRCWFDDSFKGEDEMTQAEFNALLGNNPDFGALIWRVKALVDNVPAVEAGPTKGETNQVKAELDALKAELGAAKVPAIPPGTTFVATTK